MKTLLLCGVLIAAAAPAAAASIQVAGDVDVGQVKVRYGDLDLNRTDGADALIRRVRAAAETVCGVDADRRDLGRAKLQSACVTRITEATIRRIDSPAVTARLGKSSAQTRLATK